jgi:hypothetical protein
MNTIIKSIVVGSVIIMLHSPVSGQVENIQSNPDTLKQIQYSLSYDEKQPRYPGGAVAWQRHLIKHMFIPDSLNTDW